MICDDCLGFWGNAATSGNIRVGDDGQVTWAKYSASLADNARCIESKVQRVTPRCSVCTCIWFSLTENERSKLRGSATCVLSLHVNDGENKPVLNVKFVDEREQDLVPFRMIALFAKESDDGTIICCLEISCLMSQMMFPTFSGRAASFQIRPREVMRVY